MWNVQILFSFSFAIHTDTLLHKQGKMFFTISRLFLTVGLITSSVLIMSFRCEDVPLAKDMNFTLNNGNLMPMVGFGTYQIRGRELIRGVLDYALGAGYRLIDSASVYQNEEDIGAALKELLPRHNLSREDIFITTKLSPRDQGTPAYEALKESLRKLDCGYIDLYLIHWPGAQGVNVRDKNQTSWRDQSWEQMVRGVKEGLVKNIGVSNYLVRHLKQLLANDHGIKPVVNQVEWHPRYHPSDLLEFCRKENILLQAYSSLGGTDNRKLLNNGEINKIAEKLGKTAAQVLLRWSLQQNIAIIPKARAKARIEENIDLNFNIPEEDMQKLSSHLPKAKYAWDPESVV